MSTPHIAHVGSADQRARYLPGLIAGEKIASGVYDATKGTVPVGFLTLLDGADPGQVKQEVSAEVASSLGGYARLGAVEHGEPQGDTSAMEDVSGLQAVQQAVAAAPGT
jgi:acetyl-CoA synthetase